MGVHQGDAPLLADPGGGGVFGALRTDFEPFDGDRV